MAPFASMPSTSNCNWYDASSSNAGSLYSIDETMAEPPQLVPNVYDDSSYGLPYSQPVHVHPVVPTELGFPNQMIDSSAFHGTPMPHDKMQNSIFHRATDAMTPTSFDANARSERTALAEPLNGYAPCEGPRPWNYAQCYGFYGEPACPLVDIIDIEDFM